MQQTADQRRFISHFYSITNPIKAHEADVVAAVLGHGFGKHVWRFRKNHFCSGCGRELSALDYFFSAIRQHSVEFLNRQILGEPERGVVDDIANQMQVKIDEIRIDIAQHALDIGCLTCGTENYGIKDDEGGGYARYFYAHPGPGGSNPPRCEWVAQVIRIGDLSYQKIIAQLGISD